MARPRHPDKELEALLRDLERQNWTVKRGKGYFLARCPCAEKHQKWIHLTPRRGYAKRQRYWFESKTCYRSNA